MYMSDTKLHQAMRVLSERDPDYWFNYGAQILHQYRLSDYNNTNRNIIDVLVSLTGRTIYLEIQETFKDAPASLYGILLRADKWKKIPSMYADRDKPDINFWFLAEEA